MREFDFQRIKDEVKNVFACVTHFKVHIFLLTKIFQNYLGELLSQYLFVSRLLQCCSVSVQFMSFTFEHPVGALIFACSPDA